MMAAPLLCLNLIQMKALNNSFTFSSDFSHFKNKTQFLLKLFFFKLKKSLIHFYFKAIHYFQPPDVSG